MGLLKGFLFAIPVGIYFGERNLDFPFTYVHRPERNFGYLKIDFLFIDQMLTDLQKLMPRRAE